MAQVYPSPAPAGYSETATQSAATNKPVHPGFRSPDRWVSVYSSCVYLCEWCVDDHINYALDSSYL